MRVLRNIMMAILTIAIIGSIGFIVSTYWPHNDKGESKKNSSSESSVSIVKKKASSKSQVESSKAELSSSEMESNSSDSSVQKVTQAQAEQNAMSYFNSFEHSLTDGWAPKVDTSATVDNGTQWIVTVFDTPSHMIEFDVDKVTGEVTSPNGSYGYQSSAVESFTLDEAADKARSMITDQNYVFQNASINADGNYSIMFRYGQNQYPSIMVFDTAGNLISRTGFDN